MFLLEHTGPGLVTLSGRLDAAEAESALRVLNELTGPTTADCSSLEYISSAGLGVLVQTYKRLYDLGHPFRLSNVPPRIRNVLNYAGLSQILGIG